MTGHECAYADIDRVEGARHRTRDHDLLVDVHPVKHTRNLTSWSGKQPGGAPRSEVALDGQQALDSRRVDEMSAETDPRGPTLGTQRRRSRASTTPRSRCPAPHRGRPPAPFVRASTVSGPAAGNEGLPP